MELVRLGDYKTQFKIEMIRDLLNDLWTSKHNPKFARTYIKILTHVNLPNTSIDISNLKDAKNWDGRIVLKIDSTLKEAATMIMTPIVCATCPYSISLEDSETFVVKYE